MDEKAWSAGRSPRLWAALAIFVAACLLTGPFESIVYGAVAQALGVHRSAPNTLAQASYGLRMLVRLVWNSALWIVIALTLGRSPKDFPMRDGQYMRHLGLGLVTGLIVMLLTIVSIWALRFAVVSPSGQSLASTFRNGTSWLFLDLIGAIGEEIFGRAVVLVIAERFFGWKVAMLISGLMFSGLHLFNPGAAWLWLLRLFLQGALLAYAVFRTQSLWWSVAYHTGWNWISAPLFGAAGSGYIDEGHIFNFVPRGSVWITGGAVGPEGSVFAFFAVLLALGLLLLTTKRVKPEPVLVSSGQTSV